jgi:hypothetical protein
MTFCKGGAMSQSADTADADADADEDADVVLDWGWLYGMEMDSYKSQILDGVLVQKQNRTSRCLKLHVSVSQFFGTKRTHSCVPVLKGEALFLKLHSFFAMSADRRSKQIRMY